MEIKRYEYRQTRQPVHKRRYSPKILILVFSVFIVTLYVFLAVTKPLELPVLQISNKAVQTEAPSLSWPSKGYAAVGTSTNGVLASSSSDTSQRPTASVAKAITALVVLDKKPLAANEQGPSITLTASDEDIYHSYQAKKGSVAAVTNGEVITERQLLEGMMLPSANNMADTLAIWAYGSLDEYVKQANTLLGTWGLSSTKVDDASGFSPNTVSTTTDLLKLAQRVIANETLKTIVAEKSATLPVAGQVKNLNSLLNEEGVIGIKTGYTDQAGGCLLFAMNFHLDDALDTVIIGVIMGNTNVAQAVNDAKVLLGSAKLSFASSILIKAGDVVGSAKTSWGNQTDLVAKEDLKVYSFAGQTLATSATTESVLKLNKNQKVGSLTTAGGIESESVDIVATGDLNAPSIWWRLRHYF